MISDTERAESIRRARENACRRQGHDWRQPYTEIGCPRPPKRCLRCGAFEKSFTEETRRMVKI